MIPYDEEPLEVGILKKQLARLTCKCSVCEKSYISGCYREESNGSNKEVQTGFVLNSLDQSFNHDNPNFDLLCNAVSCPGCYITLNLLKARGEPKVFKDEEIETMMGISCCDKSSGKHVKFVECSTSTTSIKSAKNSSTSLAENVTNTTTLNGIMKKRSNEHVTFLDFFDHDIPKQDVQTYYGQCFCLQQFIDSIRPPLTNP